VAHVGSLAVSGDGSVLLLACFSDGLYRYGISGPPQQRIALESPCPLAAVSYDGETLLTADRANRACLRDYKGSILDQLSLDSTAVAIALGALGDWAAIGLANGSLLRFEEPRP
jgi:hypothetical protein